MLKKFLSITLSSTAVLLLVFLVVLDQVVIHVRPLQFFDDTGLVPLNQEPLVSKVPVFLRSPENPEVILLGSSTWLIPSVRCDNEFEHRRTRYDSWYGRNYVLGYNKSVYFAHLLSQQTHQNLQLINLGVVASMMSDQYFILRKLVEQGKRPRLVICGIAPRDFLDNYRAKVEKTPVAQVLSNFRSLAYFTQHKIPFAERCDFALSMLWYFYKVRADYRTFLSSTVALFSGHPVNLAAASTVNQVQHRDQALQRFQGLQTRAFCTGVKPDYVPKPNKLVDLDMYKHVYYPLNTKLFEEQTGYLEKFLKLAHESNTPVVLVSMPLTQENLSLLPATMIKRYRNSITDLANKYEVPIYFPADTVAFHLNDFEDSVHLNGSGGHKMFRAITEFVGKQPELVSRLTGNQSQAK